MTGKNQTADQIKKRVRRAIVNRILSDLENRKKERESVAYLNIFNSGFVVDLNLVQKKAIEIAKNGLKLLK